MSYFVQISLVGPSYYEGEADPRHLILAYDLEEGKIAVRRKRYLEPKDDFSLVRLKEKDKKDLDALLKEGLEEVVALVKEKRFGLEAAPYRHAEIQFLDFEPFLLPDYLFNPGGNDLSDRYEDYPDEEVKTLYRYFQKSARFLARQAGVELPLVPLPQKGEADYRF